MGNQLFMQESN